MVMAKVQVKSQALAEFIITIMVILAALILEEEVEEVLISFCEYLIMIVCIVFYFSPA